jgi:LysR family transcriptional regulator, glycine cleavage system transcriptional activator
VAVELPSLAALRSFESAARHSSFRAAAEELSVTQSAISHHVADLERQLGVKLFVRAHRGITLTDAGALYFPYLADAFRQLERGTAAVVRSRAERRLDIQVYVTVAVRWLIPRMHSFRSAHPDIPVRFSTSHSDWEFDEAAGDVGIVCTDRPDRPGLDATHLFDARLVPVCSPALLHAGIGLRQPADLVNHSLLQLYTALDEWPVWLRAAGMPDSIESSGPKFDSYLLAIEAAMDGQGVALAPDFVVAGDLHSGRLVAPFALTVAQPRRWYLVCRAERRDDEVIGLFRDWLRAEIDSSDATRPGASDPI